MKINKEYAPIVLRIGISLTFLWFGLTQIFNPATLSTYLPNFMYSLPIEPLKLVMINGLFETIFGLSLLIGFHTRLISIILSFHLFLISFSLGYNDIAIRDIGLAISTLAIFFHGDDKWCKDWGKNRKW